MTVVEFPSAGERMLWVCQCGCRSFTLYADDVAECADCGAVQDGAPGSWREKLPDAPARAEPIGDGTHSQVVSLQSAKGFLTRIMRRPGLVEEVNVVIAARPSGGLHVWGHDFSGEEARAWLKRRLAEAEEILTK